MEETRRQPRIILRSESKKRASADDAGIGIVSAVFTSHPPRPAPYDRVPEHLVRNRSTFVPPLSALCLHALRGQDIEISEHLQEFTYIKPGGNKSAPDILKSLIPFYDVTDGSVELHYVHPEIWLVLSLIYTSTLPRFFRVYQLPLSDPHVLRVQKIEPSARFDLVTALSLPCCQKIRDDNIQELGALHQLVYLDLRDTPITESGIHALSRTLRCNKDEDIQGTRNKLAGPWKLRTLYLRDCKGISDTVCAALASWPLLCLVDLRDTWCRRPSIPGWSSSSSIPLEDALFAPNRPGFTIRHLTERYARLLPTKDPYILHIDAVDHASEDSLEPMMPPSPIAKRTRRAPLNENNFALIPSQPNEPVRAGRALSEEEQQRKERREEQALHRQMQLDQERTNRDRERMRRRYRRYRRHRRRRRDLEDEDEDEEDDFGGMLPWDFDVYDLGGYHSDSYDSEEDDSDDNSDDDSEGSEMSESYMMMVDEELHAQEAAHREIMRFYAPLPAQSSTLGGAPTIPQLPLPVPSQERLNDPSSAPMSTAERRAAWVQSQAQVQAERDRAAEEAAKKMRAEYWASVRPFVLTRTPPPYFSSLKHSLFQFEKKESIQQSAAERIQRDMAGEATFRIKRRRSEPGVHPSEPPAVRANPSKNSSWKALETRLTASSTVTQPSPATALPPARKTPFGKAARAPSTPSIPLPTPSPAPSTSHSYSSRPKPPPAGTTSTARLPVGPPKTGDHKPTTKKPRTNQADLRSFFRHPK